MMVRASEATAGICAVFVAGASPSSIEANSEHFANCSSGGSFPNSGLCTSENPILCIRRTPMKRFRRCLCLGQLLPSDDCPRCGWQRGPVPAPPTGMPLMPQRSNQSDRIPCFLLSEYLEPPGRAVMRQQRLSDTPKASRFLMCSSAFNRLFGARFALEPVKFSTPPAGPTPCPNQRGHPHRATF